MTLSDYRKSFAKVPNGVDIDMSLESVGFFTLDFFINQ